VIHPWKSNSASILLVRFGFGALDAEAEFIDAIATVQSFADFAFRHDVAGVAFVFLSACCTYKPGITHFLSPSPDAEVIEIAEPKLIKIAIFGSPYRNGGYLKPAEAEARPTQTGPLLKRRLALALKCTF
jgi:hypothetical protein